MPSMEAADRRDDPCSKPVIVGADQRDQGIICCAIHPRIWKLVTPAASPHTLGRERRDVRFAP